MSRNYDSKSSTIYEMSITVFQGNFSIISRLNKTTHVTFFKSLHEYSRTYND